MRYSFRSRTVLITGGGSGIGLAFGRELASHGAHVTLADIDGAGARSAAEQICRNQRLDTVRGCALDVRDREAFRSVVDMTASATGTLDVLFNNAGISMGGPTEELTSRHWDRIIDVNVKGVVNGVLASYPRMIQQGHGLIVNTASGVGLVGAPYVAAYSTTKHAVVGLSTALRAEASRRGVSVSVLCPDAVETPILDRLPDDDLPHGATPPATGRDYARVLGAAPMPADAFAKRALRSVARGRAIIVEPRNIRSLWYLHRLSPRLTELIGRRIAARVYRELIGPDVP